MRENKNFMRCIAMVAIASMVGVMSSQVDAGSLGRVVGKTALERVFKGSVTRSLGRRSAAGITKAEKNVLASQKPRDIIIFRSRHPQAAAHIEHAQKTGQPTVLHIDRSGAGKRRTEAIGDIHLNRRPAAHYERDEYPPAFTREGGANANVRFIDAHDNRGAGAAMRWQSRGLPDGSKVRVLVK